MSTSHTQPLGISAKVNVQVEKGRNNDVELRLKKVQTGVIDQKQTIGIDAGRKTDSEVYKKEIEHLKRDLERAKGKISRRDETIKALEQNNKGDTHGSNKELEKKLNDLVEYHRHSKAKYKDQLTKLEFQNKNLQETLLSQTQEITNLKWHQSKLEKENTSLLKQVDSLKELQVENVNIRKEIREYENEKLKWKVEKHNLERHISTLQTELDHVQSSIVKKKKKEENIGIKEDEFRVRCHKLENEVIDLKNSLRDYEGLESENDRLQNSLVASSISYRLLYKHTISKDKYQTLEKKFIESQDKVCSLQNQVELLKGKFSYEKETNQDLQHQLNSYKKELRISENVIQELMLEKQHAREEVSTLLSTYTPMEVIKPLKPLPTYPLVDLVINHNFTASSYLTNQLHNLEREYFNLLDEYEKTTFELTSSSSTLTTTQRSFDELKIAHNKLEESHQPCPNSIAELQLEVTTLKNKITQMSSELKESREEARKSDKQAKEDRESLKRANEVIVRSKMAEEALDEEVKHLQEAYTESAKYEELYFDLKEQYELLESRELAAIEEAEKLGLENAELAGHNNEGQKINYVEGVRREMVLIKQELASTRYLLNISTDKVLKLENEIQAYKSIDQPQINGLNTSRTRVMRRQPENGRLTVSRNGPGKGGRSVSGPIGRY